MLGFILSVLVTASPGEEIARGRAVFLDRCSMCHGERGDAKGPLAAELPLPPRNFLEEPLQWGNSKHSVMATVRLGRSDVMPSFEGVLTPSQISDVAAYVWSIIPPAIKARPYEGQAHKQPRSLVFFIFQRNGVFTPSKVQAQVGDTLIFVNDDPVEHEVHDLTKAPLPLINQKPRQWDRLVLSQSGTLQFDCSLHPAARLVVEVSP